DGLWDAPLQPDVLEFIRQFPEAPGILPYYCGYHCLNGMVGQVMVTSRIGLMLAGPPGATTPSWSGGARADVVDPRTTALFATGAGTVSLPPDGGDAGTSLLDSSAPPAVGSATFFLVVNKQPAS